MILIDTVIIKGWKVVSLFKFDVHITIKILVDIMLTKLIGLSLGYLSNGR